MNKLLKIGVNTLKYRNSSLIFRYPLYGSHQPIRCILKPDLYSNYIFQSYATGAPNKSEIRCPENYKEPEPSPASSAPKSPCKQDPPNCGDQGSSSSGGSSSGGDPPSPGLKYILLALALAVGGGLGYLLFGKKCEPGDTSTYCIQQKKKNRVPATTAEIPKEVPYLLIGGGTASFSAFRAIKSHDPKAKVMVISKEVEMPYMRPPLSKELWFNRDKNSTDIFKFKQWNGVERSLYYEPDDFYVPANELMENPNGGVTIVRGYEVKEIDVCDRSVKLEDGTEIRYGECLIATGSSPRRLDAFEKAPSNVRDKVSVFRTTEDYERLRASIPKFKSIAIVGGGFLGSELACALAKYEEKTDLKVYQIFCEDGNMGKVLPQYLSNWATERVREEGVNVMPNSQIKSVERVGEQIKLELLDGRHLYTDHVLIATGSVPNTQLAGPSKLEVDEKHGGFLVNAELEARRHVFVAGDAACFFDPKLGRRRVEHHDHAVVSGRLAGENMVGLKKPYTHQSMFWSDLGPYVGYEAIGIVDASLPTVGVFAKATATDIPASSTTEKLDGTSNKEGESKAIAKVSSATVPPQSTTSGPKENNEENYGKGVIFYLRDDVVVGVLLWNVFNRIGLARKVIAENKKFEDLNEVAKLFDIFEQKSS